jgi:hypothetical protein
MMCKIKIFYFPLAMVYVIAPLLAILGLYLVANSPAWGIILCVVAVILATTHYVTFVDSGRKEYGDYLSFLWIKCNAEYGRFSALDRVVITKETLTYKAGTRYSDRTGTYKAYTATLFLSGDQTLDLTTATEKREVLRKIKPLCLQLGVAVEDRSVVDPYFIDIAQVS